MIVTNLNPSTTYYFRVCGINIIGNGKFSNVISITTKSLPEPEIPKPVINPTPVKRKIKKEIDEKTEERRKKAEKIVNKKQCKWKEILSTIFVIIGVAGYVLFIILLEKDKR